MKLFLSFNFTSMSDFELIAYNQLRMLIKILSFIDTDSVLQFSYNQH